MAFNCGSDLSSPLGRSVNDYINPLLCSLPYASVEDAAAFILRAGQGALLAKLDIKPAYRNIPIHPGDRHLLGMRWEDRFFVDACLPFGLHSASKIFNATADVLERIIANGSRKIGEFVLHYLDNFLFAQTRMLGEEVCEQLGFPVMSCQRRS